MEEQETFQFGDDVWVSSIDGKSKCRAKYIHRCEQINAHYVYVGGELTTSFSLCEKYNGQDQPKTRPMTRDEVFHFVTNTPGIVSRPSRVDGLTAYPAQSVAYVNPLDCYEWSYSSPTGEYVWNKFEVAL